MSFETSSGKRFDPSGLTKLALLLASMMVLMGSAAVSPALHGIEVELGTSKFLASMVISLPSLVVAVTGFPMGYLADRVGLAKILIVSQRYHLYRAIYDARALGLDAYGVAAEDIAAVLTAMVGK